MSTSLYQKYRPQRFAELVNQAHVRTTLLNELKQGSTSHAYLFSGPRGVGKTTTARLLARAVNCQNPTEGEPCNECDNCKLITSGRALDVVEIDAASHTGVDNVRENIIENARVAPSQLAMKVFIIDEVHMLSTSAFNALLKTLEEPPKQVIFILATTEIHKLPATIISRCERFQFRKIGYSEMEDRLRDLARREGIMVADEVISAIAKQSEGALRDGESLLGQILSLDDKEISMELASIVMPHTDLREVLGLWTELLRGQLSLAIQRINRLRDEGVLLTEFTKELIDFLRKVLLYRVQDSLSPLEYLDLSNEEVAQVGQLAAKLSPKDISEMIEVFMAAQEQLKDARIIQLPLELAAVKLTGDATDKPIPSVVVPSQPTSPTVKSEPVKHSDTPVAPVDVPVESVKEVPVTAADPMVDQDSKPFSLEQVYEKWNDLLEEMKRLNHALHLTMKVGKVVSVEDNRLIIGFEYQFYQDRLNDAHNRPVLDKAFANVFGIPVIVETVIGSEYALSSSTNSSNIAQPSPDEVANVWELASSTFGNQFTPQGEGDPQ